MKSIKIKNCLLYFVFSLVVFSFKLCFGNNDTLLKKNLIGIELGGGGHAMYSLGYTRNFDRKKSIRIGLSYCPIPIQNNLYQDDTFTVKDLTYEETLNKIIWKNSFSLSLTYLINYKKLQFYGGITHLTNNQTLVTKNSRITTIREYFIKYKQQFHYTTFSVGANYVFHNSYNWNMYCGANINLSYNYYNLDNFGSPILYPWIAIGFNYKLK